MLKRVQKISATIITIRDCGKRLQQTRFHDRRLTSQSLHAHIYYS